MDKKVAKLHHQWCLVFKPLPNNKILDVTKLKAFADDKFNIVKMMISL